MGKTKIQWTRGDDGSLGETWNPVRGCTKISPGCKHCYAATFAERFRGVPGHPYEQGFDLRLVPDKLAEPLHWKKPRRIFVNSMSDLFHDDVPESFLDSAFAVMALASQHTYQVLTKRAERMSAYMAGLTLARLESAARGLGYSLHFEGRPLVALPLPSVWLGVSVENQECADERIPHLLRTPAAVRFLSCEPLLGGVYLHRLRPDPTLPGEMPNGIDWVIVGGESGHGARPMRLEWARSIVEQCKAAGTACFVKQLGPHPYERAAANLGARQGYDPNDLLAGASDPRPPQMRGWTRIQTSTETWYQRHPEIKDSHGGDPAEWPADLRVREFPQERR